MNLKFVQSFLIVTDASASMNERRAKKGQRLRESPVGHVVECRQIGALCVLDNCTNLLESRAMFGYNCRHEMQTLIRRPLD